MQVSAAAAAAIPRFTLGLIFCTPGNNTAKHYYAVTTFRHKLREKFKDLILSFLSQFPPLEIGYRFIVWNKHLKIQTYWLPHTWSTPKDNNTCLGGYHTSVDSSARSSLQPQVRIRSTPCTMLYSWFIWLILLSYSLWICHCFVHLNRRIKKQKFAKEKINSSIIVSFVVSAPDGCKLDFSFCPKLATNPIWFQFLWFIISVGWLLF